MKTFQFIYNFILVQPYENSSGDQKEILETIIEEIVAEDLHYAVTKFAERMLRKHTLFMNPNSGHMQREEVALVAIYETPYRPARFDLSNSVPWNEAMKAEKEALMKKEEEAAALKKAMDEQDLRHKELRLLAELKEKYKDH